MFYMCQMNWMWITLVAGTLLWLSFEEKKLTCLQTLIYSENCKMNSKLTLFGFKVKVVSFEAH